MSIVKHGKRSKIPRQTGIQCNEYALMDLAKRLSRHREGRIAVHVHLSRLLPQNRRSHHIRVAIDTLECFATTFGGHLFELINHDVIFVARDLTSEKIDEVILKLRYLFSEDPLTRSAEKHGDNNFCTWYFLERDYHRFYNLVRRAVEICRAHSVDRAARDACPPPPNRPMTPALLARMEKLLSRADVSNWVRRQSVCAVLPNRQVTPVFSEIYVSIGDLERQLLPGISLAANRWLFQYFTAILDQRVLRHVVKDVVAADIAFSLNLNVATVLSKDFRTFDSNIGTGLRGRVAVEFQKLDVFADMGAYRFARDFLQERGYRVCLDGLTHLTIGYIDHDRLGLDLLKMHWSPEITNGAADEVKDRLRDSIRTVEPARMILTRCDGIDAINTGLQVGINMFQGRQIDAMIAAAARPAGATAA